MIKNPLQDAIQIFNNVTDVTGDVTVTTSEDMGSFSWIMMQFNTASSNPSATRLTLAVPGVYAGSISWYPLANGGSVRLIGSGTALRIVDHTLSSLYLIRVYGYR